jgi:hypothetical protein
MANITEHLTVDYIVLGRQRGEIHVVPEILKDGQRLGSGDRRMIPVHVEVAAVLIDSIKAQLEVLVREHESVDQFAEPALPATDAIVIDGKEVRPALPGVPARQQTMKKTFPPGMEIKW